MSGDWTSWTTEAAMVADFTAWAAHHGWTSYAETAGWDVLLVRDTDGFQVGVEAKLSLNALVLLQVLSRESSYLRGVGPDCHAVLVPAKKCLNGLDILAKRLSIVVIVGAKPRHWDQWKGPSFSPELPRIKDGWENTELRRDGWPERCPDERHRLPDYVPDVTGGHSSPVALTEWKVKAIKVAVLLEVRGYVTRADFKHLNIDPSRWTQFWLRSIGDKRWVGKAVPNFKSQHPVNYEQIKSDFAKWAPPAQPVQGTLLEASA